MNYGLTVERVHAGESHGGRRQLLASSSCFSEAVGRNSGDFVYA